MAALNDLEVKAADVQNACLTAPVSERTCPRLGPEFGSDHGKVEIIVRASHGLRGPARCSETTLRIACVEMGHVSCKADADVWLPQAQDKT
jgi:hypothetical protein